MAKRRRKAKIKNDVEVSNETVVEVDNTPILDKDFKGRMIELKKLAQEARKKAKEKSEEK